MRTHCAAVVLLIALVTAVASAPAGALDAGTFVPLDEIEPGDRCVGRTVFAGTEISEFEIEILGVVEGTSPGGNLIIGRAIGEPLERTGILQGMSGSPVYLGERLVGALSSSWAWSTEPLAGITPIEEMLPALEPSKGGVRGGDPAFDWRGLLPAAERARSRVARIARVGGLHPHLDAGARDGALRARYGGAEMRPLAAPLVIPGCDDAFLGRVADILSGTSLAPVRGGAAAAGGSEILPGSAVGVQLVRGDQSWTAIGTVTHRDGDRILAFGHPLFGAGPVEMPLVSGFVHALMPLRSVSFKFASGADLVGAVTEDRSRVVAGTIGASPSMMPLEVGITGGVSASRDFRFEVVRGRPYAPAFAGLALAEAIAEEAKARGPATVALRVLLTAGPETLEYRDMFYTEDPAFRCAGEVAGLADLVLANRFAEREVDALAVEIDLAEERRQYVIERVETDREAYAPGEEVELRVSLRAWRGPVVERTMSLELPGFASPGVATAVISGGSEFLDLEADRLGEGLRPRTYEQLAELVQVSPPGNALVAQIYDDRPGLSLAGRELASVPGRAALVVASGSSSGAVDRAEFGVLAESTAVLDGEVIGGADVSFIVKKE